MQAKPVEHSCSESATNQAQPVARVCNIWENKLQEMYNVAYLLLNVQNTESFTTAMS